MFDFYLELPHICYSQSDTYLYHTSTQSCWPERGRRKVLVSTVYALSTIKTRIHNGEGANEVPGSHSLACDSFYLFLYQYLVHHDQEAASQPRCYQQHTSRTYCQNKQKHLEAVISKPSQQLATCKLYNHQLLFQYHFRSAQPLEGILESTIKISHNECYICFQDTYVSVWSI